jgi:hypothetical protein
MQSCNTTPPPPPAVPFYDVYQYVATGLAEVRMTADSTVKPIQTANTGILVRRINDTIYPDTAPDTGYTFLLVEFSSFPKLVGFMFYQQKGYLPGEATVTYLAKTATAIDAQRTLNGGGGGGGKKGAPHPARLFTNDLYQVTVGSSLRLRTSPETEVDNIIQNVPSNIVMARLDDKFYPDTAVGSGALFMAMQLSTEPLVQGYAALQLSAGGILETYLAKTVASAALERANDAAACRRRHGERRKHRSRAE